MKGIYIKIKREHLESCISVYGLQAFPPMSLKYFSVCLTYLITFLTYPLEITPAGCGSAHL